MVIKAFKQMLTDIVGENFLNKYCKLYTECYKDLLQNFKVKTHEKMDKSSTLEMITLKISPTFSMEYEKEHGTDISSRTRGTKYAKTLTWFGDKVRIKKDLFDTFFKPSCDKIIDHIRKILDDPNLNRTTKINIILVGSFSKKVIVQMAIRSAFPQCRVLIPEDAGQAVLKGAVLLGYDGSKPC